MLLAIDVVHVKSTWDTRVLQSLKCPLEDPLQGFPKYWGLKETKAKNDCVNIAILKALSLDQMDSQVATYPVFHWLISCYNNESTSLNLCRLWLGGQTVKNVCRLVASKFVLDQHERKWTQVNAFYFNLSTCESVWLGLLVSRLTSAFSIHSRYVWGSL